jgi:hypothetical protein
MAIRDIGAVETRRMTNATRPALAFQPRRTLVTLLLAACMILLAGCSWFEPPKEVAAEAQKLAAEIRGIAGVTEVEVDVRDRDFKDHPGDWIFSFTITTADAGSLNTVPSAVRAMASNASAYAVNVTLGVPADRRVAAVFLHDLTASTIDAATALRDVPEINSAEVGGDFPGAAVEKSPDASLAETAAALRTVTGFGANTSLTATDPLRSITVRWDGAGDESRHSVEVGTTSPSPSVLNALDQLGADSSVSRIYALEQGSWPLSAERPAIEIDAIDANEVLDLLVATVDSAAEAGTRPRTAFQVTAATGARYNGFVGLPLGSDEPQDLPVAPGGPVQLGPVTADTIMPGIALPTWVLSTDPAVLAQIDTLTAGVEGFFDNAEALSGVAAETRISIGPCATSDEATSVTGSIVLPIFEITDSADEAYGALVRDWELTGLVRSDRALGLDMFSNPADDAAVATATMRGTVEGISISATSQCL